MEIDPVKVMEVYRRVWEMERRLAGDGLPICLEPGCYCEAVCNYAGLVDMPAYCEGHARFEMDRRPGPAKHRGCEYVYRVHVPGLDPKRRCDRVAVTGVPGGRRDRCAQHVGAGRKWKPNQKCQACGDLATWGWLFRQASPGSCEWHKVGGAASTVVEDCSKCGIPKVTPHLCSTCGASHLRHEAILIGAFPPPIQITYPDELVPGDLGAEELYGVRMTLVGTSSAGNKYVAAIDDITIRMFEAFVDIPRWMMISQNLSERYPGHKVILVMAASVSPQKIRAVLERVVADGMLDSTLVVEIRHRSTIEHAE